MPTGGFVDVLPQTMITICGGDICMGKAHLFWWDSARYIHIIAYKIVKDE
jgi:hypothetical protein